MDAMLPYYFEAAATDGTRQKIGYLVKIMPTNGDEYPTDKDRSPLLCGLDVEYKVAVQNLY